MTCVGGNNACVYSRIAAIALLVFVALDRAYVAFWAKRWNPPTWRKIVLVAATVGALWLVFRRDTWLPFLGETVVPPPTFLVSSPDYSDTSAVVSAPPGSTRVVYWAASSQANTLSPDPETAYGKFENSGVAQVVDGKATLKFRKPGSYRVRWKTMAPHVHYRFVFPNGISSEVKTLYV
jgi:hypothetical protein